MIRVSISCERYLSPIGKGYFNELHDSQVGISHDSSSLTELTPTIKRFVVPEWELL